MPESPHAERPAGVAAGRAAVAELQIATSLLLRALPLSRPALRTRVLQWEREALDAILEEHGITEDEL